MHFSQALPIVALAVGVQAESYVVQVSNQAGALRFNPDTVTANVGDTVEYVFERGNHSVTEADFNTPCTPLTTGFNSGFHPVAANNPQTQDTFTYTVADTNPHWFYCAQARHCESGMVGVINPPSSGNTLAQFNSTATGVTATVVDPISQLGTNGTVPFGSVGTNGTTNGTVSSSAVSSGSAAVSTSFALATVTNQVTTTNSAGQTITTGVVVTTSSAVAVPISSQGDGVKGQLVGFGAAAAGLAAMLL